MKLKTTIQPQTVSIRVNPATMGISFANPIARDLVEREPYAGSYTITPSSETQTLETNGCRMVDNIIIEPIPQSYGLITWDGSSITVS